MAERYLILDDATGQRKRGAAVGSGSGGYIVYGSPGSPISVGTSGITASSDQRQLYFVNSSGGAVTVTANPQITAGTIIGQELEIIGTSDTNYPIFNDGNGLSLNGVVELKSYSAIRFIWDSSVWVETSRR